MPFLWFFTCLFHGFLKAIFMVLYTPYSAIRVLYRAQGSLHAFSWFFTGRFQVFLQVLIRVLYRPFQCSLHALFRFFTGLFQLWFFTHSYSASVLFNTGRFVIFMVFLWSLQQTLLGSDLFQVIDVFLFFQHHF